MTLLPEKTPDESRVEMTEMVLPQHTNALGTVFGGVVMSWVDIAAAVASGRHSRQAVVTASIDAMHFLAPIKLGWVVTIKASVNYVHKSSCEVGVKVLSENPRTGERFHTATAYATFVALDEKGKPALMPTLKPVSEEDKHRYDGAKKRRASRLALKQDMKKRRNEAHD